jgi:hypothetical protein
MNTQQFISILVWQLIVVGFVLAFRSELAALISRIRSAEIFGQRILTDNYKEVRTSQSGMDAHISPILLGQGLSVPANFIPRNDPTAVYFFSHDLMLTYAAILTGARKAIADLTIRSASAHFTTLGFDQTPVNARFLDILNRIQKTDYADWTNDFRAELANDIWVVSRFVGDVIQVRLRSP